MVAIGEDPNPTGARLYRQPFRIRQRSLVSSGADTHKRASKWSRISHKSLRLAGLRTHSRSGNLVIEEKRVRERKKKKGEKEKENKKEGGADCRRESSCVPC